jgi:hypothetical protein
MSDVVSSEVNDLGPWPLEMDQEPPSTDPWRGKPFPWVIPWPNHRCLYCHQLNGVVYIVDGGPGQVAYCQYCDGEWEVLD